MTKYIETAYCKLWIKDNILHCLFQPYLYIDLNVIQHCVEDRIKFTEGNTYPMIADVKNLKFFDTYAREYLATQKGCENILAIAFLAETQIEKFMVSAFIEINFPPVPCQIFDNKELALDWLAAIKQAQEGK